MRTDRIEKTQIGLILHKAFVSAVGLYVCFAATALPLSHSFAAGFVNDIDRLLALPERRIDIGIAALTLAKEVYPSLDVNAYSAKIDRMVEEARIITRGRTDPDYRIRALNTYLYKSTGLQYDLSDPYVEKPENRYLNGILDTKKGSCVTMPLLYLAIAQRLGYPVYPVNVPYHLFLRYVDPTLEQKNIEATGGGGFIPDDEYKAVLQISKKSIKTGAYLRTLSYHELVAHLIVQNAIMWGLRGEHMRAILYMEKAIRATPRSADNYRSLGRAYSLYSKTLQPENAKEYMVKAERCFSKAEELGVTKLSNKNYMTEQKKAQDNYRKKHKEG
jgi:regulator of sirC expression with transglutaminase-like and TPR domain